MGPGDGGMKQPSQFGCSALSIGPPGPNHGARLRPPIPRYHLEISVSGLSMEQWGCAGERPNCTVMMSWRASNLGSHGRETNHRRGTGMSFAGLINESLVKALPLRVWP